MKPNIVLQTDFGLTTGFVSSMYGVIKMVDAELDIYDLNHEIRPFLISFISLFILLISLFFTLLLKCFFFFQAEDGIRDKAT